MMKTTDNIQREITPLGTSDCFMVFNRKKSVFSFPIHFHPEYELNFIRNGKGAKRIIGDHIEEISDFELVLTGPNLLHAWENWENDRDASIHEITIQFSTDLYGDQLLNKNILNPIRLLLINAEKGILFSQEVVKNIAPKIDKFCNAQGFESYIQLQNILQELALSEQQRVLTNISFQGKDSFFIDARIERIYQYINTHFNQKLSLAQVAKELNLTTITLGRLVKKSTGKTFVEFVNEIRLGNASRQLIETNLSIAEICFLTGFSNISNFNRIFKKRQNCTPLTFRQNYSKVKKV